jgi:hypothetical protein
MYSTHKQKAFYQIGAIALVLAALVLQLTAIAPKDSEQTSKTSCSSCMVLVKSMATRRCRVGPVYTTSPAVAMQFCYCVDAPRWAYAPFVPYMTQWAINRAFAAA